MCACVFIHTCVCTHMHVARGFVATLASNLNSPTYFEIHTHTHTHTRRHAGKHTRKHTHTHTHTHTHHMHTHNLLVGGWDNRHSSSNCKYRHCDTFTTHKNHSTLVTIVYHTYSLSLIFSLTHSLQHQQTYPHTHTLTTTHLSSFCAIPPPTKIVQNLRQYLNFCTSKASKLNTYKNRPKASPPPQFSLQYHLQLVYEVLCY